MKLTSLILALAVFAGPVAAQDPAPVAVPAAPQCVTPVVPTLYVIPVLPPKPDLPKCVNPSTHMSTCSHVVLQKYNDAVDARNAGLQDEVAGGNAYVNQLNNYMMQVNTYNNCEIHRLNTAVQVASDE